MPEFKNGDVLIHNNDHSAELIFMSYIPKSDGSFIAWSDDENDYDVYTDEQWKIKPKKEKRKLVLLKVERKKDAVLTEHQRNKLFSF